MRFITWSVRRLNRAGSLTAATKELARYKLDLVGIQEVRWDEGDTVRQGITFFMERKENHQLRTGCFLHHRIVSEVKRVEVLMITCHM